MLGQDMAGLRKQVTGLALFSSPDFLQTQSRQRVFRLLLYTSGQSHEGRRSLPPSPVQLSAATVSQAKRAAVVTSDSAPAATSHAQTAWHPRKSLFSAASQGNQEKLQAGFLTSPPACPPNTQPSVTPALDKPGRGSRRQTCATRSLLQGSCSVRDL